MTKKDFLDGKSFRFLDNNAKGYSTYRCEGCNEFENSGALFREIRSNSTDEVLLTKYHLNITKVTTNSFSGFVFVVDKRVNVRYFFRDMVVVE